MENEKSKEKRKHSIWEGKKKNMEKERGSKEGGCGDRSIYYKKRFLQHKTRKVEMEETKRGKRRLLNQGEVHRGQVALNERR